MISHHTKRRLRSYRRGYADGYQMATGDIKAAWDRMPRQATTIEDVSNWLIQDLRPILERTPASLTPPTQLDYGATYNAILYARQMLQFMNEHQTEQHETCTVDVKELRVILEHVLR